jgi:hypothetical protein
MKVVMHTKRLLVFTAVASLLALLSGCTHHEGAMVGQRIDSERQPNATIHLNQVVILDRSLQDTHQGRRAGKIAVERHGAARMDSGALQTYATFRNRTDYPQQLECRVQFFGSQEEPVEGPSAWQRIVIPPLGVGTYRENSMANNVAYYYVEVREGR